MSTIRIRCACGEEFHAAREHAGRHLRCRCGRTVEIRHERTARATSGRAAANRPSSGSRRRRRTDAGIGRIGRRLVALAASAARPIAGALRGGARGRGEVAHGMRDAVAALRASDRRARVLALLAWGYLLAAGLAWFLLWGVGDRWWPGTVLLFGPRWVLLLPLLLLAPAAAAVRRSLLLPLAAAVLVLVVPVVGLRLGLGRLTALGAPADLRLVTVNVAGSEAVALALAARLDEWRPDVVAVQECGVRAASLLGRLRGWHARVDEQLCLLSRLPIVGARTMDRRHLGAVRESGLGGTSQAVRYVLDHPRGPVHVANVHLETPRKGLEGLFADDLGRLATNTTLRDIESRQVRRWLGADVERLLVAGDFNMPVESTIYRRSWGDFRNAFSRAGIGLGATRDNGWIQVRIDHVLAGDTWRVLRARVGDGIGSDHRPVIADLRRAIPDPPRPAARAG